MLSLPIFSKCVVSVSVVAVCGGVIEPGPKTKALGILIFSEVVGIGPRNIRKISENSKYA